MNATYCGKYWSESKYTGGFFRLNVIMGYIMSIAGFTMVYGSILILIAPAVLPLLVKDITPEQIYQVASLSSDLLYILIVTAVIPSGFFIWFNSLAVFWKKKNISNGLTAGWNTYAQIRNVVNAYREVPNAFERIVDAFFGGNGKKKKSDTMILLLVIFIIIIAILGGYFTAAAIKSRADESYDAFAEEK